MSVVAPWTVLDSVETFADPWLRVRSDRVRTAGGDVFGPFHVIEYPDWSAVVPLLRDSHRLLLVREYRHGVRAILPGLPGGIVDRGDGARPAEAARAAAERELLEETGFGGGTFEHLATLHPNPSNQSNAAHCFLSTGLSRVGAPRPGENGEAQEVIETDLVQVIATLRDGGLVLHAVHAAALWTAAARIAADRSGRFGSLPIRLRRFLSGQGAAVPAFVSSDEKG